MSEALTKGEAEVLFDAVFKGEKAVLGYFGAEGSAHWDYDLADERKSEWCVVDGDTLVHELQVPEEWCQDDPKEGWTYSGHIRGGFFEGPDFSLALVDLQQGGSGAAMILDNTKRLTPPWEKKDV